MFVCTQYTNITADENQARLCTQQDLNLAFYFYTDFMFL